MNIIEIHQKKAFEVVFETKLRSTTDILFANVIDLPQDQMFRLGLMVNNSEEIHFLHRTFAEYFVADFFVEKLVKESYKSTIEMQSILKLFSEIAFEEGYIMVQNFFGSAVKDSDPKISENTKNAFDHIRIQREFSEYNPSSDLMIQVHFVRFVSLCLMSDIHTAFIFWTVSNDEEGLESNLLNYALKVNSLVEVETLLQTAKQIFDKSQIEELLIQEFQLFSNIFHAALINKDTQVFIQIFHKAKENLSSEKFKELLSSDFLSISCRNDSSTKFNEIYKQV